MQLLQANDARAVLSIASAPLSVVFAETDAIRGLHACRTGTLKLQPPHHVCDEGAYLVVPDDIGGEIVDIMNDGDEELLHETMRDSLVALGDLANLERADIALDVADCMSPEELLSEPLPYAARIPIPGSVEPVRALNTLPHAQCTTLSALVDDEGLEQMLRSPQHIGISWRVAAHMASRLHVDPTYAWSRRTSENRVGIELALFVEQDELVALLRPALIELGA